MKKNFFSRVNVAAAILFSIMGSQSFAYSNIITDLNIMMSVTAYMSHNPRQLNLCYISLNNEKEFGLTKTFIDRVQAAAGIKLVTVTEFQAKGSNPEDTINNMIHDHVVCDGLVISGHHTGAFGGERSSSMLSIEFMEKASCEPGKSQFFSNINSLWLQGCRTLGSPSEVQQTGMDMADFHAARVDAVRGQDHLEADEFQMSEQFSNVLDQETPYVSRFIKSFPHARIYGWTLTAPGEESQSERSVPYHIHDVAQQLLLEAGKKTKLKSPFSPTIDHDQAMAYMDALVTLLLPAETADDLRAVLAGWINQGHPEPAKGFFGLENAHLDSLPPLMNAINTAGQSSQLQQLNQSRTLECSLRNDKDKDDFLAKLDQILADQNLIRLTFYTLKGLVDSDGDDNTIFREEALKKMRESKNLKSFLITKINAPHVGVVRRIQFFGLYDKLNPDASGDIIKSLKASVKAEIMKPAKEDDTDALDFKANVIAEALQNNIVTTADLGQMLASSSDLSAAKTILSLMKENRDSLGEDFVAQMFDKIANLPKASQINDDLGTFLYDLNYWTPAFSTFESRMLQGGFSTALSAPIANPTMPAPLTQAAFDIAIAAVEGLGDGGKNYAYYLAQFLLNPGLRDDQFNRGLKALSADIALLEKNMDETDKGVLTYIFAYAPTRLGAIHVDATMQSRVGALMTALRPTEATILKSDDNNYLFSSYVYLSSFNEKTAAHARIFLQHWLPNASRAAREKLFVGLSFYAYAYALTPYPFLTREILESLKGVRSTQVTEMAWAAIQQGNLSIEMQTELLALMEKNIDPNSEDNTLEVALAYAASTLPNAARAAGIQRILLKNDVETQLLRIFVSSFIPGVLDNPIEAAKEFERQNPDSAYGRSCHILALAASNMAVERKKAEISSLIENIPSGGRGLFSPSLLKLNLQGPVFNSWLIKEMLIHNSLDFDEKKELGELMRMTHDYFTDEQIAEMMKALANSGHK